MPLILSTKLTHPVAAAVTAKSASDALQTSIANLAANRLKDATYKETYQKVQVPPEMVKELVDAIVVLRAAFDLDPASQDSSDGMDAVTNLAAQFTDDFGIERG